MKNNKNLTLVVLCPETSNYIWISEYEFHVTHNSDYRDRETPLVVIRLKYDCECGKKHVITLGEKYGTE